MKSTKVLWIVIACLVLALGLSILINTKVIDLSKSVIGSIVPEKTEKVLQLSDIKMTLVDAGTGTLLLNFKVKNISKEPQNISLTNLSIFDYNGCRYEASTTFSSLLEIFFSSETINPNSQKQFSALYEVPKDELYVVGYSDSIEIIGKQVFIDEIRKIKCEYETFEEMIIVRNRLAKNPSEYKTFKKVALEKSVRERKILIDDKNVRDSKEIEAIPIVSKETDAPKKNVVSPDKAINPNDIFRKGKVKGKNGESVVQGKGSGVNEGVETGGAGTGYNTGGSESTFSLLGRESKSLSLPQSNSEEVGSIVVTIWVNPEGKVTRAVAGARGTTIDNRSLWRNCENASSRSTFSENLNAPFEQKGTITYKFRR